MTVTIYVEGKKHEGKFDAQTARLGFGKLFENAGFKGRMPSVVMCGGRGQAMKDFTNHNVKERGGPALLLVDAEELLVDDDDALLPPWDLVRTRKGDAWKKPKHATEDDLHLMVVTMETWLLCAPPKAWTDVFGKQFDSTKLLQPSESHAKSKLTKALNAAVKAVNANKPNWENFKGSKAFELLAKVDVAELRKLQHAKRLVERLEALLPASK